MSSLIIGLYSNKYGSITRWGDVWISFDYESNPILLIVGSDKTQYFNIPSDWITWIKCESDKYKKLGTKWYISLKDGYLAVRYNNDKYLHDWRVHKSMRKFVKRLGINVIYETMD